MTTEEINELKELLLSEKQDVHRGVLRTWLFQNNGDRETKVFVRVEELLNKL